MAWDEFTACAGEHGQIFYEIGEEAVKQLKELWDSLSDFTKTLIKKAVDKAGPAVLIALGISEGEAAAIVGAGLGLGAIITIMYDCYDKI